MSHPLQLFDISVSLHSALPGFPQDPPCRIASVAEQAGGFHVSQLSCSSHVGTHLDLAGHAGLWGYTGSDLPLKALIGPCRVVDLRHVSGLIGAEHLRSLDLAECRRLLLKTNNSHLWRKPGFCMDYQSLGLDGARFLGDLGIELVGIDYLSIEAWDGDGEVHHRLLRDGGVILEGLDLSAIDAGAYELICLPLKLACADGAPCRALLRR